MSVSAGTVPDLKGTWTGISVEQYSPTGGFENGTADLESFQITGQDGRVYVGKETYYDQPTGKNVTEIFSGALSPDGHMYELDNEGSGISFGEIVSDHEFYNTMLFPERGPMIISFHMVKSGTNATPSGKVPELIGTWNLTHNRKSSASTTGHITIDTQQGRIWSGTEEVLDDDGTTINVTLAGTVGETGRLYAASSDGAFMFGSLAGDDRIQSAFIIPGDTDGTYVVDRVVTKNKTPIPQSDLSYPVMAGDWKIDDRKVIENGKITKQGPVSDEWVSFSNQTGKFFTAVRHNRVAGALPDMQLSGIFRLPNEAFLTGADSEIVIYHVLDNSSIEAIVNRKDNNASVYLDLLTRKPHIKSFSDVLNNISVRYWDPRPYSTKHIL
ncbi:MAG: hypothetical protein NTV68_09930 [Methanomicrobiales archaeon]|nr:hypothetical protein [Methanomicrobiales archaeon]